MEVVLEEAPVPVEWVMRKLHAFVARSHQRGGYLPHLATFTPSKGDIIIVRHLASTPEIPDEHISLEVRRADEAGFDATAANGYDVTPKVTKPAWDGRERRRRPQTAKPFGRRGLN